MRSVKQAYEKLRDFCMFRVGGGELPVLPCFLVVEENICAIWRWETVMKQNEYVPILIHRHTVCCVTKEYMYDQFRHGQITCGNCAYCSTSIPQHCNLFVSYGYFVVALRALRG